MNPHERIIVALDIKDVDEARRLVELLSPHVGCFKVGLEFITSSFANLVTGSDPGKAADLLDDLRDLFYLLSSKLFWDGKWDDIPNTLAGAALGLQPVAPQFLDVHASAGRKAVEAVVANRGKSRVLGVTVLTSVDPEECVSIFGGQPPEKVLQFARTLLSVGADGIICSPQELSILGTDPSLSGLIRVTPGVRPAWAAVGDQKRVMTPAEAIKAGATYLVIGRPITKPPQEIGGPVQAARSIAEEIEIALKEAGRE